MNGSPPIDGVMPRGVMLVKSGGRRAMLDWQALFARHCPGLDVRAWNDPDVHPDSVTYALVWEPDPGRLAGYRNLRVIFSSGAGVDHVTRDPHLPPHVPIVRMGAGEAAQTMGEYVCLGALALLRDYRRIVDAQAQCRWDPFDAPRTAVQTRVGILGLGNLGRRCAAMLRALGFQVAGWARTPREEPGVAMAAGMEELPGFLAATDILVGLLPDTPQTAGLMNAERLAQLPAGAAIINAGRGSLIVMDDLIAALDRGHLSGAILDVFDTEPLPPEHPAWRHPRIGITSHLAGFASRPARAAYVAEALAAHAEGREMPNVYKPERGY
jgi:glyoxylate/hydroxypyruvate reductase A